MTLATGTTLLHYRLAERIGEGGMGEVWRAADTTLDRDVAIKILPAAFAADPERLARFEREARVLASLTHPNIAGIYGLHEADGVRFLAMELVPGEDLAERLARGAMPVDEAIDAAKQIAAALAAAHDSGIVHRDLKPANVKRTPDGTVKVLDFGLAKALETAGAPSAQSATITSAGSVAGMILGTAAYMSPEQARGQLVDRRTDIWSFGCLLYEMLSAKRAFDGPTITDVLAAVVTREPDWDTLPSATPVAARRLMRRCLEKDQRKRLRDAGDAILLLEENPEDARIGISPTAERFPAKRTPVALVAALIVGAIAVGAVGSWLLTRGSAAPPSASSPIVFRQLTFGRGMMRTARFAPDGKTIVYGAAWNGPPVRLYLSRTDSTDSTPLQIPDSELLSVSKTGELAIALGLRYSGWMGSGTLARVPLLGGTPREIAENVAAADWTPDGSDLAIVYRDNDGDRLEFPAGKVLYRTKGYIADVRFAPDGTKIAFTDHPVYADDRGDLAVVDLQGHKTTLAAGYASIHGAAWGPGGHEIWFEGQVDPGFSAILAVDLAGHARVALPSVSFVELFDVSPDGRVLIASHNQTRGVQALLAGYDDPRPVTIPGESSLSRWISPDGRSILVTEQLTGEYDTFLARAGEPGATHLGPGDGMGLSADGRWALSVSADAKRLYVSPVGAGKTRTVPNPDGLSFGGDQQWLPDGKRIVTFARAKDGPVRGYVIDAASGTAKPFTAEGVIPTRSGKLIASPDGKYVLMLDPHGTIVGWPVDGGEPKPIPGWQPTYGPLAWSEDGRALFCVRIDDPWQVFRLDLATGATTPWTKITAIDPAGLRLWIDVMTSNGKYWAVTTAKIFSDLFIVDGLN
jgi:eukaryotic-like serine/threonine-protein kinase